MSEIGIILTGWYPNGPDGDSRLATAYTSIESWQRSMPSARLYIIDGSKDNRAKELCGVFETLYPQQGSGGVGEALNIGIRAALERSPIVFYAADDWELLGRFDFRPWVRLLETNSTLGMVRLGPPHPGISGTVEMNEYGWHLRLDRHHFAFGHRPALYHARMFEHYGWLKEGVSPLECEDDYNMRFCHSTGPDIALALPHPWEHIGEVELGYMQPEAQ